MQIIYYPHESIDSTNTWAKQNCHHFQKDALSVVWAKEQRKGRGRHGRTWISPPQDNVTASFVIFTNKDLAHFYLFSECMAICLKEQLLSYQVRPRIKWPNDILINDKKIAGILIESAHVQKDSVLIVGVGINVNMTEQELLYIPKKATSLFVETKKNYVPLSLIVDLSHLFVSKLSSLEQIPKVWKNEVAWMVGQKHKITTPNRTIEGVIQSIDEDGTLHVVQTDTKEAVVISNGEI